MFAVLWRSSLALPTAEGDRSPRADGETAKRATLGLPEKKSRILLGKYLRLEISLILYIFIRESHSESKQSIAIIGQINIPTLGFRKVLKLLTSNKKHYLGLCKIANRTYYEVNTFAHLCDTGS